MGQFDHSWSKTRTNSALREERDIFSSSPFLALTHCENYMGQFRHSWSKTRTTSALFEQRETFSWLPSPFLVLTQYENYIYEWSKVGSFFHLVFSLRVLSRTQLGSILRELPDIGSTILLSWLHASTLENSAGGRNVKIGVSTLKYIDNRV